MIRGDRPTDAETTSPPSTTVVPPGRAPGDTAVNLLFGLLALQNNFIDRDALVAAFNSWLAHRSRRLGEILAEHGALSANRRALLDELVEEHLQLHGNAPEQSLAALGSIRAAGATLSHMPDSEVRACLALLLTEQHVAEESDRTASFGSAGASTSADDRFRILRPHARGGLGEVFVALDTDLHREVALKEIQTQYVDDPRHRERFEFEAIVTGGLEHPGIVPVYALGHTPDGRPYYAMRFIRGNSLKEAVRRFYQAEGQPDRDRVQSALEFRELLGRFMDVCDAISYAHSRSVLHRDLKPGNIMLGPYGETLVVDWGLAKTIDPSGVERPLEGLELPLRPPEGSDLEPTQAGSTLGTPGYMSPEQAAGRLDLISPRTDVYGLGATLYHLLTDRAPCEGEHVGEVLQMAKAGNISQPRVFNPAVAPALEAICLKALAREPERRYDTAAALKSDIERWLADEPVSAWREPWVVRARRWLGRHHTFVTAAAATVLVAAASLALATVLLQRARGREVRSLALAEENLKLYHESIDKFYNNILGRPEIRTASMETLRRDLLELGKEAYERNLVPRINTPAARAELGRTYLRYALILEQLGDARHAPVYFQEALSVFGTLNRSLPGRAEYLVDEARVLCELGRWHQSNSPKGTAVPFLERAMSLLDGAARLRPGDARIRFELARTRGVLGRVYSLVQVDARALETLRRSVADLDALASEHPEVIEYRERLARSLMYLGDAYQWGGEFDQARAAIERLCEICEAMAAGSSGNPEYQLWLGQAYQSKAALLGERRSLMADAIPVHQQALRIFEALAAAHPDVPDYQKQIVDVAMKLAVSHHVLKHPPLMRQSANQALSRLDRLIQAYPDVSLYRNQQAQARIIRAAALARLREYAQAEQELDQTVRGITSPGWKYAPGYEAILAYSAACGYALSAESVLSDAALPPSERANRAAACRRRAVAQLCRSFQAGYPATLADFKEWNDEDIRVLGTDPEFRELVAQIEAKLRAAPRPDQEGKR